MLEQSFLLLDKPCGISSNKALQQVRSLFSRVKAGHAGSLDPLASGMLPIFFGKATKFTRFLLEAPKHYRVIARLGITTTTGDCEGAVICQKPVPVFSREQILMCLRTLEGVQEQLPPLYSALKVEGKPLYAYARKGLEVKRQTRTIHIHHLSLLDVHEELVTFEVACSKGTYVRTLVESLGERLGYGAHTVYLRRLSVADFQAQSMIPLDDLLALELSDCFKHLISIEEVVQHFPAWHFSQMDWEEFKHGRAPSTIPSIDGWLRGYDPTQGFIGVIRCQEQQIVERCLLGL